LIYFLLKALFSADGVSRVAPTSTSAADKKNMRIREQQPKMSAETWLEIFRAWPKTTLRKLLLFVVQTFMPIVIIYSDHRKRVL
jgi:hypothetical protein